MNIDALIKAATLEKNGAAKEAYRAIKTELLLNNSSKNPKSEGNIVAEIKVSKDKTFKEICNSESILINELDLAIIRKLIKQREDSISIYEANSRKELADIEKGQLKYLKELLPPEISDDQIKELILSAYPTGYSQKEMGKVIKLIKETFPTVNGKKVSELVKQYIQ